MSTSSAQFIFTMHKVSRFHPPDREVLKDISLSFYPGAKIGVIGSNGSGKSSLLRIMAGLDDGYTGEARLSPGFTVGLLEQEPHLDETKDVKGNVMDGVAEVAGLLERYDAVLAKYADPDADYEKIGAEQAELEAKIQAAGADDLDRQIEIAMDALRLPPGDADVTTLSGGERRRVALCRLLLSHPDLLLLDEPTNHLDAESVAWLERTLQRLPGHRRGHHPRPLLPRQRGPVDPRARAAARATPSRATTPAGSSRSRPGSPPRRSRTPPGRRTLERELEWVRMAPKARQAKGKARLAGLRQAPRRGRGGRARRRQAADPAAQRASPRRRGDRGRRRVEGLRRPPPHGGPRPSSCRPAGIVGVIGPNGAGKTTLFRMITGQEQPDAGTFTVGETVDLAYVDQSRDSLDADATVYEEITGGAEFMKVGNREVNGRAYVSNFNFKGSDQQKKVGLLSGGERNRVLLAKMLKERANVLLLDEPTNDLDVDTLRALEDALEAFAGCAVVISHDRWFLDRIATHILAFEGDSQVRWFEGNFSEYEEWRHKELGAEADQPHRIKYKPLAR